MLYYFQNFRRVCMFMWEQTGGTSGGSGIAATMGSMKLESIPSTKQKVYQNMFENMRLGDHTVVVNLIVTKMGKNLKFWPDENDIVAKALELLTDMAGGCSSLKLLLTLSAVKYLASHHTQEEFPFWLLENMYGMDGCRYRSSQARASLPVQSRGCYCIPYCTIQYMAHPDTTGNNFREWRWQRQWQHYYTCIVEGRMQNFLSPRAVILNPLRERLWIRY